MKKILTSSAIYLVLAILLGCLAGSLIRQQSAETATSVCGIFVAAKSLSGQIIFFMVPFLILGCVTPSIAKMNGNASKVLIFAMLAAYLSSVSSAFVSMTLSHFIVPSINIGIQQAVTTLPDNPLGNFSIPTIHPIWALGIAIIAGLTIVWTRFEKGIHIMDEFQKFVLCVVRKVMMPLLPLFVGSNFAIMAYSGQISNMKVFLPVIAMVVLCQLVWIVIVYAFATAYSGKNGWTVLKHYAKAYFTALGSMSSVVTLPISLECIKKSCIVNKKTYDFTLPLFSSSNLCGSVIAEIALMLATYFVFYHSFPPVMNIIYFIIIACVLSIGSPGVPGGLNVACSSILGSLILNGGEIDTFMGVMTALYTLQDGFGTACNVVTAGALTLVVEKKMAKKSRTQTPALVPAA